MTPGEALALLRSGLSDVEAPQLWTDPELYTYIDDAQTMFCRLTDGIADASTVAVTKLTYVAGAEWLPLDPSILKIRSAFLVSTGAPLTVINQEDMANLGIRFDGSTGAVKHLITGMEENRLRCSPVASLGDSIQLSVFRIPLIRVTGVVGPPANIFEIPQQHHLHLLLWAKHLAYEKQDAETFDKFKSAEFADRFQAYCVKAKAEQRNKRHKVRTVAYGGY